MNQRKKAFTLIELIIVVVIIGILAIIAIPRYFANVGKSQKAQACANLDRIRQAALAYYAVYGVYPIENVWPIVVVADGDTIVNMTNPPGSSIWTFHHSPTMRGGQCWATSSDSAVCSLLTLYNGSIQCQCFAP
jgi:prepilin-type N-terminal cleavage/methylation domain-containing protein